LFGCSQFLDQSPVLSVTSARLTTFKTLASGTSAELTLITSRTSSTDTPANADSDPKTETGKKPNLRNFGEKNPKGKTVIKKQRQKNSAHLFFMLNVCITLSN